MNTCILCKGKLAEGIVNHVVDIEGYIIIVKNVPASICKQCGEYYLEHKVALNLEQIVEEVKKSKVEIAIINYFDRVA